MWQSLITCNGFSEHEIYIFCDGPKNEIDKTQTDSVINFIKNIKVQNSIYLKISNTNIGLATNVICGVSEVLKKHNSVIVLEDDLIVTTNFLEYMKQALCFYKKDDRVFSISGYSPKVDLPKDYGYDIYFTTRASSWGWATWHNQWNEIDWKVQTYQTYKKSLIQKLKFSFGGSDLPGMLRNQMKGKINSWAIRWVFHQFMNKKVTVYPTISKVSSIGFGDNATHTKSIRRFITKLDQSGKNVFRFKAYLSVDKNVMYSFRKTFSYSSRLKDKISSSLHL